jgi:DNA recombination protein RmuC
MSVSLVAVIVAMVLAAAVLGLVLALRRPKGTEAAQVAQALVGQLQHFQGELSRLARVQEDVRRDVQASRETSLLKLAEATQGIRGELGQAQRVLAEVKALEQGRARQLEQAADSLRRLEAVVAGSASRGAAGENILAHALAQLPADLLEVNVSFGSKVVEYALRLPGGRLLPIDSKWTSAALLERLDADPAPADRRRLLDQIARDMRAKIRDMTKYLDPERTLSLGLLAVPDAVYAAAPEAHFEGYREGVLVVPYSLALPYVLALYRLTVRFGAAVDTDQLAARLRVLEEALHRSAEEVEARLSRSLVQLENSRDALRDHLGEARRAAGRLRQAAEAEPPAPLPAAVLPAALAVGEAD